MRAMRVAAVLALSLCAACATVPRRAEVVSLASEILSCPSESIDVRVAPIDEVCAERSRTDEHAGPCLEWMPLEGPAGRGWIVEGCGHIDRFASVCEELGSPVPAEWAFSGETYCANH